MRTSLIELQQIEEYVFSNGTSQSPGCSTVIDSEMAEKVRWQKDTYAMVHRYSRQKLKNELEAIHQKLFTESRYSRFRRQVMRLFT